MLSKYSLRCLPRCWAARCCRCRQIGGTAARAGLVAAGVGTARGAAAWPVAARAPGRPPVPPPWATAVRRGDQHPVVSACGRRSAQPAAVLLFALVAFRSGWWRPACQRCTGGAQPGSNLPTPAALLFGRYLLLLALAPRGWWMGGDHIKGRWIYPLLCIAVPLMAFAWRPGLAAPGRQAVLADAAGHGGAGVAGAEPARVLGLASGRARRAEPGPVAPAGPGAATGRL